VSYETCRKISDATQANTLSPGCRGAGYRGQQLGIRRQGTKQLGSLDRDGGIDKAIGKKDQDLSLWRRLL